MGIWHLILGYGGVCHPLYILALWDFCWDSETTERAPCGIQLHVHTVFDQVQPLSFYFRNDSTAQAILQSTASSEPIRGSFRKQPGCLLEDFYQLASEKDRLQGQCVITTARETFKVSFLLEKATQSILTNWLTTHRIGSFKHGSCWQSLMNIKPHMWFFNDIAQRIQTSWGIVTGTVKF